MHSLVACQGIALQHQPLRDALFQIDRNCSTPNLNTWHVQSKGGEPDFDSTVSINTTRPATSKTGHPFYSILRHLGLFLFPSEQGFHDLRNHQTPVGLDSGMCRVWETSNHGVISLERRVKGFIMIDFDRLSHGFCWY